MDIRAKRPVSIGWQAEACFFNRLKKKEPGTLHKESLARE
jgi:hypothetical protein